MIIVTGGCGFVGSNIVIGLNRIGRTDIIIVDNLENGFKFKNLISAHIADYVDKDDFRKAIAKNTKAVRKIDAIFHQGACSSTTEYNGKYLLKNNYEYSKILLHYAINNKIPFIYASSAAVYGLNKNFEEKPENELPLNPYAYSKLIFDNYVRAILKSYNESQIVGLRYFNLYGLGEEHKQSMASAIFNFANQIKQNGICKVFGEYDGCKNGEQRRDFTHVEDAVKINLWFAQHSTINGIYNVGSGVASSFKQIAELVISFYNKGTIEYIDFPEQLKNKYQSFTQANIEALRSIGYKENFIDINTGIYKYLEEMS